MPTELGDEMETEDPAQAAVETMRRSTARSLVIALLVVLFAFIP